MSRSPVVNTRRPSLRGTAHIAGEAALVEINPAGASHTARACKHQSSSRGGRSLAVAIGHRQPRLRRRRAYPREHEGRCRAAPHERPAPRQKRNRTPTYRTRWIDHDTNRRSRPLRSSRPLVAERGGRNWRGTNEPYAASGSLAGGSVRQIGCPQSGQADGQLAGQGWRARSGSRRSRRRAEALDGRAPNRVREPRRERRPAGRYPPSPRRGVHVARGRVFDGVRADSHARARDADRLASRSSVIGSISSASELWQYLGDQQLDLVRRGVDRPEHDRVESRPARTRRSSPPTSRAPRQAARRQGSRPGAATWTAALFRRSVPGH
jgi:hypothetical protein